MNKNAIPFPEYNDAASFASNLMKRRERLLHYSATDRGARWFDGDLRVALANDPMNASAACLAYRLLMVETLVKELQLKWADHPTGYHHWWCTIQPQTFALKARYAEDIDFLPLELLVRSVLRGFPFVSVTEISLYKANPISALPDPVSDILHPHCHVLVRARHGVNVETLMKKRIAEPASLLASAGSIWVCPVHPTALAEKLRYGAKPPVKGYSVHIASENRFRTSASKSKDRDSPRHQQRSHHIRRKDEAFLYSILGRHPLRQFIFGSRSGRHAVEEAFAACAKYLRPPGQPGTSR